MYVYGQVLFGRYLQMLDQTPLSGGPIRNQIHPYIHPTIFHPSYSSMYSSYHPTSFILIHIYSSNHLTYQIGIYIITRQSHISHIYSYIHPTILHPSFSSIIHISIQPSSISSIHPIFIQPSYIPHKHPYQSNLSYAITYNRISM